MTNIQPRDEASRLLKEFGAALKSHDARQTEPYTGPYHFRAENERIGLLLGPVDRLLRSHGAWPKDRKYIGNSERVALLSQLAMVEELG